MSHARRWYWSTGTIHYNYKQQGRKDMNGPTYSPPITDWTDCWDQEEHDEECPWDCDSEADHDENVSDFIAEMAFDASRE